MTNNLYEVLGVTPDAADDELRAAYRRRAREEHPDASGSTPDAQVRMAQVNEAWRVLGDPSLKRAYDREIGLSRSIPQQPAPAGHDPIGEERPEPAGQSSPLSAIIAVCSAFGLILVAVGFAGGAPGMAVIGVLLLVGSVVLTGYRYIGAMRPRR
jgi:curved DNA-binding protein CbpA